MYSPFYFNLQLPSEQSASDFILIYRPSNRQVTFTTNLLKCWNVPSSSCQGGYLRPPLATILTHICSREPVRTQPIRCCLLILTTCHHKQKWNSQDKIVICFRESECPRSFQNFPFLFGLQLEMGWDKMRQAYETRVNGNILGLDWIEHEKWCSRAPSRRYIRTG